MGDAPAAAADWGLAAGPWERLERGRLSPARVLPGAERLLVYYGAGWCGPCRAFVPELKRWTPELAARRIAVAFVSDDANCRAQREYQLRSRMPWLLLPCGEEARAARLRALGGAALPGFVVLDREGRVLATSWQGGRSSPRAALARLLAPSAPPRGG